MQTFFVWFLAGMLGVSSSMAMQLQKEKEKQEENGLLPFECLAGFAFTVLCAQLARECTFTDENVPACSGAHLQHVLGDFPQTFEEFQKAFGYEADSVEMVLEEMRLQTKEPLSSHRHFCKKGRKNFKKSKMLDKFCPIRHETHRHNDRSLRGANRGFYGPNRH